MKFYLAARYSRRNEMQGVARELRSLGHTVVSRWLHADPNRSDAQAAAEDIEDLEECSALILFTEEPNCGGRNRGGRHVEFGWALGRELDIFVIAPRENVFHYLPEVKVFDDMQRLLLYLAENEPMRALCDESLFPGHDPVAAIKGR